MDTVKTGIIKDLAYAMVAFSEGKLSSDLAQRIAEKVINNVDLKNEALMHKGTNWLAKEILGKISY